MGCVASCCIHLWRSLFISLLLRWLWWLWASQTCVSAGVCPAEAIGAWQDKKSPGYYSASKIFGPQDALRILYILRDSKIRFYNSIWYHLLPAFVAPDDSGCAHSHRGRTRQGCMMLSVVLGCACWSWIGWIAWTLRQVSKLPSWDHCLSNLEEGIFFPMWHDLSPFWSSQER